MIQVVILQTRSSITQTIKQSRNVPCGNCEISNGGSHKATLIVQSSGQSRHPEITGRSQMRINVADSFHRIENASVWCNKAFNGTRKRGWSGQQLLSPDDPSTRDTVVKAGKSERYPTFRGILGYIRVNKTRLTLQVQFRSRKSWFFSQEGQFEDHSPVDRWTEEIWKISFWNNLDKLVVRAIRRYCEE